MPLPMLCDKHRHGFTHPSKAEKTKSRNKTNKKRGWRRSLHAQIFPIGKCLIFTRKPGEMIQKKTKSADFSSNGLWTPTFWIWLREHLWCKVMLLMVQKSCVHQLSLVVYPIFFRVLYIQKVVFPPDFWTISSINFYISTGGSWPIGVGNRRGFASKNWGKFFPTHEITVNWRWQNDTALVLQIPWEVAPKTQRDWSIRGKWIKSIHQILSVLNMFEHMTMFDAHRISM